MKVLQIRILLFSVLCSIQIFGQNQEIQSCPDISIISVEAQYVGKIEVASSFGTSTSESSPKIRRPCVEPKYVPRYLYSLKFSFILRNSNPEIICPLDIKLTTPTKRIILTHIEDDISMFNLNEFYDYRLEIKNEEIGWFTFEIGTFSAISDSTHITFDKSSVYFPTNEIE